MRNEHKKTTYEDKFAREFYCRHARLNAIRRDKRMQHKSFRQNSKKVIDNEMNLWYSIYRKKKGR